MYEKMNTVTIGKKKVPIKCNLAVLVRIQEEYGTLKEFEQKLIGMHPVLDKNGDPVYVTGADGSETLKFKTTEPSLKAITFCLPMMLNEGKKQAEEQGEEYDYDYSKALDDADFSIVEIAVELHNEYRRCFDRKKLKVSTRTATKK